MRPAADLIALLIFSNYQRASEARRTPLNTGETPLDLQSQFGPRYYEAEYLFPDLLSPGGPTSTSVLLPLSGLMQMCDVEQGSLFVYFNAPPPFY